MKKILIPPFFILLGIIADILLFLFMPDFNLIPYPYNLAGIFLISGGFVLVGKTHNQLKARHTPFTFDAPRCLVKDGLFSWSRNPMYIGQFVFLMGVSICFMNVLALAVPVLFMVVLCTVFVPFEEKRMEEIFGNEYFEYKNNVRRWV